MSHRAQVESALNMLDERRTGMVEKTTLQQVLSQLCPELKESDVMHLLSEIKTVGENVKIKEFLDFLFPDSKGAARIPPKVALKRELSKPLSDEETQAIRTIFDKFDKDNSGYIDLKELQSICAELGKTIADAQAAVAMSQLDKNGDCRVTFDEFVLWWTCTPGLGGYNHVVLGFLKGKLALNKKMNRAFRRVVRTKLDNTDEFSLKANVDITPETSGTKVQASATVTLEKSQECEDGPPTFEIKLACKSEAAAASIVSVLESSVTQIFEGSLSNWWKFKQEEKYVLCECMPPEDMFDEEASQAISFLQDAAKKMEFKVGLGATFEEVLANPRRPLNQIIRGGVFGADVLVGLTSLVRCSRDEIPEQVISAVKCFGGMMLNAKFTYNQPNLLKLAEIWSKLIGAGDSYGRYSYYGEYRRYWENFTFLGDGIAPIRDSIYGTLVENHSISEDGRWLGAEEAGGSAFVKTIKELANGCTGIDSFSLYRLPGSTVKLVAKFDKVNPFPLADYVFGHLPRPPPGFVLKKKIKPVLWEMRPFFKYFEKPKTDIGGDSRNVGFSPSGEDTYIRFQQELTPGMVECAAKMSIELTCEKKKCPGDKYSPGVTVQLKAKSESHATSAAEALKLSLFPLESLFDMIGLPSPEVTSSGDAVIVKCTAPSEVVEFLYETGGDDFTDVVSKFISAIIGSMVTITTSNDFDDLLAQPDVGIYSTFSGSRIAALLRCSADGKSLACETLKHITREIYPEPNDEDKDSYYYARHLEDRLSHVDLPIELAKVFQSLDLAFYTGYHKDNVDKAAKHADEIARMTSPASIRDLLGAGMSSGKLQRAISTRAPEPLRRVMSTGSSAALLRDDSIESAKSLQRDMSTGSSMALVRNFSNESAEPLQRVISTESSAALARNLSNESAQTTFTERRLVLEPWDYSRPDFDKRNYGNLLDSESCKNAAKSFIGIFEQLDSISSVSLDGIWLPSEPDYAVSIVADFTNFKCFDFLKYMSEPIASQL